MAENEAAKRRKVVPEEDSSDDSDSSEQLQSDVLSKMLATLQGTGDGKAEHVSRFKPFQSYSSPLGAALPAAIKRKIINGEFVHLETLLPSYKNELSICLADANSTEGKVSFSTNKNAIIRTFDQWQEAILIYGSVLLGAHPEEGVGFLKHISVVRRLYLCRAKWLWYDGEFRRLRAEEGFEFATYHHELVEQAKSYRVSYTPHSQAPHAYPSSHRTDGAYAQPPRNRPCYAQSNNQGNCYRRECSFRHVCWHCRGEHPNNKCSSISSRTPGVPAIAGGPGPGYYRDARPGAPQEGTNTRPRGGPFKLPPRVPK